MPEIDDTPALADQRPDDMGMGAPGLRMEDTAARAIRETEFCFVRDDICVDHGTRVPAVRGRIDMDVMYGAIRLAMAGGGDEFPELRGQVVGGESTRLHQLDLLSGLPRQ